MKTKTAMQGSFIALRGSNNPPGSSFFSASKAIIFLLSSFSLICQIKAQDYLVGVRGGGSFESDAGEFQQADLFAAKYLPWSCELGNCLAVKSRWEASVGCLHDIGQQGFVGTSGPVLEARVGKFPVTLEGGVSFTALSRYEFPNRDLGGWFQFTDHLGLNWHITKQFTIGWRYQHISNAGIYEENPGLNQQMLSASYTF